MTGKRPDADDGNALRGRAATIVGGGIAGLTAALALAQRGADVTVHERAGAYREVGAGIQISPNAGRVLDALGLTEPFMAASHPSHGVELRDHRGALVLHMDFTRWRPDARFRTIHRARLVELLEAAARSHGVDIRLNAPIDTPPDAPLLIGADGLHSRLRQALNGKETPFFTGQTAWRAVIPDMETRPVSQVFMGPGRHLVSYPLGAGLRNIVAVVERGAWTRESWSASDDPANLRCAFEGFGGPVPGWLEQVAETGLWGLFRHEVAARWHDDGRMAILGDAAHPTLPFLAQGACMAIEDAWTLAACLAANPDQPGALARYQTLRRDRCAKIVATASANARNYHLSGPPRLAAHTALRLANRLAPRAVFQRFAWVYDHDPTAV